MDSLFSASLSWQLFSATFWSNISFKGQSMLCYVDKVYTFKSDSAVQSMI